MAKSDPKAASKDSGNSYDRARSLAEQALEHYAKGEEEEGDRLAKEAVATDRSAVEEVVQELEEDEAADHEHTADDDKR